MTSCSLGLGPERPAPAGILAFSSPTPGTTSTRPNLPAAVEWVAATSEPRHHGGVLDVLRAPGALVLFAASCVARLPMGAVGLLLVLFTHDLTGSYGRAGLVSGAYALCLGISNPLLARVIDRHGQTLVLRTGGLVAASALWAIALLPGDAPFGALLGCAALAGLTSPPIGACMRALWPVLVDGPDQRYRAYALEGAVLEIVYICGPVAIVAGIGSWSIQAAIATCGLALLLGNLTFSLHPVSRGRVPEAVGARDLAGALRGRGVRVLIGVFALCGLGIGAVEVAIPAALDGMGRRELAGLLFGVWGVGSMVAGFAVGRRSAPREPVRRLSLLLVAWGAAHAAIGLAGSPVALAVLLFVAGAAIAPTFVCANGMLDHLAPPGTLTEAFTWMSTGMTVGVAAGSALAGLLVERASPGLALGVLGAGGVLAAVVVRASADRALRPVGVPTPA